MESDESYSNPYANAAVIEDSLPFLNTVYSEKCFGLRFDDQGNFQMTSDVDFTNYPADCKTPDDTFFRYRLYIADLMVHTTYACYTNSDETACAQIGLGSTGSTAQSNGGSLPDGDASDLAQQLLDSSNVSIDHRDQLENISAGRSPCPSVNNGLYTVNPELLRLLVALAADNTFTIASLHRGCTGSRVGAGTHSWHWRGDAVDISGSRGINGVTMPSFSAYDESGEIQRFVNQARSLMPSNCQLGLPNSRYVDTAESSGASECENLFLDTTATTGATGPHVHLGIGR
jgi:hypothetical protein